jgi:hypothetical protein
MLTLKEEFRRMVTTRSKENRKSFRILYELKHYGNCLSILRQELDSAVRVLYLLNKRQPERDHLIGLTLNNQKWFILGPDGKKQLIVDKTILDFADSLEGWERSVHEFGYSFIHVSNNYNYLLKDPVAGLKGVEKERIGNHIRAYHRPDLPADYTLSDIIPILPAILDKLSGNLESYISRL